MQSADTIPQRLVRHQTTIGMSQKEAAREIGRLRIAGSGLPGGFWPGLRCGESERPDRIDLAFACRPDFQLLSFLRRGTHVVEEAYRGRLEVHSIVKSTRGSNYARL
jgi:hypothetical protein